MGYRNYSSVIYRVDIPALGIKIHLSSLAKVESFVKRHYRDEESIFIPPFKFEGVTYYSVSIFSSIKRDGKPIGLISKIRVF